MLYLLLIVLALSLTFICGLGMAYLFFVENQCRVLRRRIVSLEKENRVVRAELRRAVRTARDETSEQWPELLP